MKRLSDFIVKNPVTVLVILCVISVLLGMNIRGVDIKVDTESMVPRDDPVIQDLIETVEEFGSQDMMMVAIKADVYNRETLAKVQRIADRIWDLPGVEDVVTPLDAQVIRGDEVGLEISPVAYGVPETDEEIEEFRVSLQDSPQGSAMVSEHGDALAIFITLEPGVATSLESQTLAKDIESIALQEKGPGEELYVIGEVYLGYVATNNMARDLRILFPLSIVVVVATLYISFGSLFDVVTLVLSILMSLACTLGLMAVLGYDITMVSMILPIILVSMGSAAGIHILNRFHEEHRGGKSPEESLDQVIHELAGPVSMTSLTTAVGFASFATSFISPVRTFGIFAAAGIMINLLITLTCVPSLLIIRSRSKSEITGRARSSRGFQGNQGRKSLLDRLLESTSLAVVARPDRVILVVLAITLIFAVAIPGLKVETNWMQYFRQDSPAVLGTQLAEDLFGGTYSLSVLVDTGEYDGVKDPDILDRMARLQDRMAEVDRLSHASSIAELVRNVNKALNADDPAYYGIPSTREAVAQELLLFTMQGGSGLDSMVSYDFQKALVSARSANVPTSELGEIIDKVEAIADEEFGGTGIDTRVVGLPNVMLRMMEKFMDDQVKSLVLSAVGVWAVVSLISGSAIIGLLCLIPLCVSVLINFGFMSYMHIPLDVVTIMISGISIGIGVDYSIHLTSRYRYELRNGRGQSDALRATITSTGRGIFFNAVTLMLGFGLLAFSTFRAISIFGMLVAGTMFTSGLGALVFLPAVLRLINPGHIRGRKMLSQDKSQFQVSK
jgi:hydrophobe/amphiphile efflux-3 (HAE3) family protein